MYHCNQLYSAANFLSLKIAAELDRLLPGYQFLARVKGAMRLNALRCLFYNENRKGHAKAFWHSDRSLWGFHWKSLFQALAILVGGELVDGQPVGGKIIRPNETTPDRVLVFFGQHAEAICARLRAMIHAAMEARVDLDPIPPIETGERREVEWLRDAIVSFIKALLGPIAGDFYEPAFPGR